MAGRTFQRHEDGPDKVIYADYINELQTALEEDDSRIDAKADGVHTHTTTEVSGLDGFILLTNEALTGKSDIGHKHSASDITSGILGPNFLPIGSTSGTVAAGDHNHDEVYQTITNVDDLLIPVNAHLSNKSNPHAVTKAQVGLGSVDNTTDLAKPISTATQTALNGKAASVHTHDDRYYTETEVNTLLAGKAGSSHTHDDRYYTESEMNTKLAAKSDTGHTHSISNITSLQTSLDAKASSSHKHTISISGGNRTAVGTLINIADNSWYTIPSTGSFYGFQTQYQSITVNFSAAVYGASGTTSDFKIGISVGGQTEQVFGPFQADQGVDSVATAHYGAIIQQTVSGDPAQVVVRIQILSGILQLRSWSWSGITVLRTTT